MPTWAAVALGSIVTLAIVAGALYVASEYARNYLRW